MERILDGGTGSEKQGGLGFWFWELKSGREGVYCLHASIEGVKF